MALRTWIAGAAAAAALALVGCTPTGACVTTAHVNPGSWDYCSDDWEQQECEEFPTGGTTFHAFTSCEELGFTKQCPGEASYRYPSYSC